MGIRRAKGKFLLVTLFGQLITHPRFSLTSALEREISEFCKSIKTKSLPRTDITHAIYVTRVLEAADKSIAQKGRLMLIE